MQLKYEAISGQLVVIAAALCRGQIVVINVKAGTRNRSGSLLNISLFCKGCLHTASGLFVAYKRSDVLVFIAFILCVYLMDFVCDCAR
jgi:hypothetical protein